MEPTLVTDARLLPILEQLQRREPIFHRPAFGTTRRATLWRQTAHGWKIVYHQGTVVADET
jgi:hypothetical protein